MGLALSILGSWLKPLDSETVDEMIVAMKDRFLKVVPGCNEIVLELKYKLLWILGYREGYFWAGRCSCLARLNLLVIEDRSIEVSENYIATFRITSC